MEKPLPVPPFQFPASAIPRRARGYDREATENVFASLAASYEKVWLERSALLERVAELEAELERMRAQEPLLRDALVDAHRVAHSTMEDARREAETIVEQARAEAEELVANERHRAEEKLQTLRRIVQATEDEITSFLREAIERSQNGSRPEEPGEGDLEHEARSA